jgi:GxxExxY protein
MNENEIASLVLDICFKIHRKTGPGLFESVYEEVLAHELNQREIIFERQVAVPLVWDDLKLEHGFRADLIVERKVIVELKSIEALAPIHHKQLLTYLRITGLKLGLLINFNESLLKNGIRRIVNNL